MTFDGSVLRWSGSLAAGSTLVATLNALVQDSGPAGTVVEASAEFTMDGFSFTRTVVTTVRPPPTPTPTPEPTAEPTLPPPPVWKLYLPLVHR